MLRNNLSRPLPGQSIAILDPQQMLVVDVFLNEDGHAQELKGKQRVELKKPVSQNMRDCYQ